MTELPPGSYCQARRLAPCRFAEAGEPILHLGSAVVSNRHREMHRPGEASEKSSVCIHHKDSFPHWRLRFRSQRSPSVLILGSPRTAKAPEIWPAVSLQDAPPVGWSFILLAGYYGVLGRDKYCLDTRSDLSFSLDCVSKCCVFEAHKLPHK